MICPIHNTPYEPFKDARAYLCPTCEREKFARFTAGMPVITSLSGGLAHYGLSACSEPNPSSPTEQVKTDD